MNNLRIKFCLIFVCCLTLEFVKGESKKDENENKVTPNVENKSQPEKRDSQKQEGTNVNNKVQQQQFSNDEPFKPIYRPPYLQQYSAAPKTEQYISQAIGPQAETYYDKPEFTSGIRYVAPSRNDGNAGTNSPSTPAHSAAPLLGSHISSSGGVRNAADAYRGPFKPVVYEYQPRSQSVVQQKQKTTKVVPTTEKGKGPHYDTAYVEPVTSFDRALSKPLQQKGEQLQQRLLLQPLHQHRQPYIQFYNPHQHQSIHHQQHNARAIPQQQHFQYIIAIPLSYVRQLQQQQQHQLATGLSAPSLRHEVPLSALKSELSVTAQPIIGPLARDNYGLYRPVHYTSNHQAQHVAPSAEHYYSNQKPQYTTQYIQIPSSVLNAAVQAAHVYQNRQHEQEQQRTSFQQSQPQYTYNIYHQQQPQENQHEQQTQHHAPVYVHPAQEKTQTQEAIIHVVDANLNAKKTPTKTYNDNTQIPPTPTSTTPFKAPVANSIVSPTATAESTPIVHYNPIYVQGPPPEQQSLFGTINYHRFATGGFHATTPVPFVRLSVPPLQHYYTSLPHHHAQLHPNHHHQHQQHQQQLQHHQTQTQLQPFHMGLEHKTIYGGYASEQIPNVADGLPYFTHPGGVHYGTHLYHPPSTFFASPSISAKATETASGSSVSNQHQQPEQQHQQSLHIQYVSPLPSSSGISMPSLLKANVATTAARNASS